MYNNFKLTGLYIISLNVVLCHLLDGKIVFWLHFNNINECMRLHIEAIINYHKPSPFLKSFTQSAGLSDSTDCVIVR